VLQGLSREDKHITHWGFIAQCVFNFSEQNMPHSTPDTHPLMTIEEAATALRLSRYTINNWLSQKKLHRVKIGRKTFLQRFEVESLLDVAIQKSSGS